MIVRIGALCLAAGAFAAPSLAQTSVFSNTGFEDVNPFSGSGEPMGWHNLSNPGQAIRRVNGDGRTPSVTARSGNACIEVKTPGSSEFRGFTTDTLNFFETGFPYYDPIIDWNGGDIVVSGYYMIPADQPITGDFAFIKLNTKLFFQDYATFDPAGEAPELQITGTTNGQWVRYEVRWDICSMREEVNFNNEFGCNGNGTPGSGCFAGGLPPYPNRVKITISRFGFGNVPSSGTIFWDDMSLTQLPPRDCNGCPADFNGDGFVDFFDFDDFVLCFEGGVCPDGRTADFNEDGFVDFFDFDDFILAFETGC
jgi:hypothetical protein